MRVGGEMKYRAEVVTYEPYGEIDLGIFDVDADNEEEAERKVRKSVQKKYPGLEDFNVMKLEVNE